MRQAYYIECTEIQQAPAYVESISLNEIENTDLALVSFWLITMSDWQNGWKTLCSIRQSAISELYLKPVIFLLDKNKTPHEIVGASDGQINKEDLNQKLIEDRISLVEPINQWIDKLEHQENDKDLNIAFKVLRMIASRNSEVTPVVTGNRESGYAYPLLDPLFEKQDSAVIEALSFLHSQSLLVEKFITRAHFCGHCGSAFLNFKDTCPHCSSEDLTLNELIHHFKCAYTAEHAKFLRGERLVCPKCELRLQHIGVDYDKPSTVYNCNDCTHSFQDSVVITTCYSCRRSADPENQDHRTIYSYSTSAIGQNAAYYGLDTLFTNFLKTELLLYSNAVFHDFVDIEVARIKRYKISSSSLAFINLKKLDQLYTELGKKTNQVFTELSSIFKSVFRNTDIISAHNETIFLVMMTETSYSNAHLAAARLEQSVKALFESNLGIVLDIEVLIKVVDETLQFNEILEEFLASTTRGR